jgi:hypothetical protein
MLPIALALIIFGIFLMSESLNMLFQMNPSSLIVMAFGAVFVFSGIILVVIALTAFAVIY